METKKGLKTKKDDVEVNSYGQAILSSNHLRSLLLQGKNIGHLNVIHDRDIELFEKYQAELLPETIIFLNAPKEVLTFDEFHKTCADEWIFPELYQQLDVKEWLLRKCKTQIEIDRINLEYKMFLDRDLVMLLRLFIYLVEYMRKNNFIWGVGRGSSVCSYALYKIGIHRVDPLRFGLDITDFLK